uniref:Required for excision 1-B domain containing n=1 Tax=Eptatretus burgeri TaxID=7764 RepID=A0A8C4QRJ9_EPTBU
MVDSNVRTIAQNLYALQEKRVAVYRKLERSHEVYLHSGPANGFPTFRQAVHEATEAFQKISHDVLSLREEARDTWPLLAVHMEQLQAAESEKLHLTVELQLAKQHLQNFPDEEKEDEVRRLKHRSAK